jgi:DNA polymerase-4
LIWGVGSVSQDALSKAGIRFFKDLLRWDRRDLSVRFGSLGDRLWHLARGQDRRRVTANAAVKSISNETTFSEDTSNTDILDGHIWRLAEKVSDRAKARGLAGRVVTLKLKRADHSLLSRRLSLREPTQIADRIYRTARNLFDQSSRSGSYRLIGVGISGLVSDSDSDLTTDLLDPNEQNRAKAERATDAIRAKFGNGSILKGRSLR